MTPPAALLPEALALQANAVCEALELWTQVRDLPQDDPLYLHASQSLGREFTRWHTLKLASRRGSARCSDLRLGDLPLE